MVSTHWCPECNGILSWLKRRLQCTAWGLFNRCISPASGQPVPRRSRTDRAGGTRNHPHAFSNPLAYLHFFKNEDNPLQGRKPLYIIHLRGNLYVVYCIEGTYNSKIKGQISQVKNRQRVWKDTSPKMYKWSTSSRTDTQ